MSWRTLLKIAGKNNNRIESENMTKYSNKTLVNYGRLLGNRFMGKKSINVILFFYPKSWPPFTDIPVEYSVSFFF